VSPSPRSDCPPSVNAVENLFRHDSRFYSAGFVPTWGFLVFQFIVFLSFHRLSRQTDICADGKRFLTMLTCIAPVARR
jgi:hypothetical protein